MGRKKMMAALLSGCMLFSMLLPSTAAKAENASDAGSATVISASDYEPDAEHGDDWTKAIQEMIADAKEADGPVVLDFPKGTYNLYPDYAYKKELYISNTVGANQQYKMKNIGFLLEDMQDVTIEGNGSMFLFHGNMTSFSTIGSTNITFQNYEFDYADPSVIDITVESVEGNSAIISVPEYYNYEISGTNITWKSSVSPYTGNTYWTARNALTGGGANQTYDASTDLTRRTGTPLFNSLSSLEEVAPHKLKFTYNDGMNSSIKKGLTYQMRNTTRDHAGMFFWKSENVKLIDVDVHFLYGFGVVFQHSTDITLDGVVFDTPEGSGRTTAGFADFLQVSGCKGDVLIQNCSFSNPHDDPINIHGTFNQVVERMAPNKFKVRYMHNETAGFPNYFVGDEVEFMTKGNMITVANSVAKVTDVQGPDGCSGADQSGSGSLTDIIITLDRDMPDEIVANSYVVENITYTPSVVIQNNHFKRTPTRGILVTTRKPVVIRDNVFDGMGMASIYISNDAQGWYESGPVRDVTIEGNTFLRPASGAGAIFIEPTNPTVSTTATVHENIKIKNNVFYMLNGQVLNAKSVKGLSFTNNEIYRYEPVSLSLSVASKSMRQGKSVQLSANANWKSHTSQLYHFNGCKDVSIGNNTYDGGLNLKATTANMSASEDLTIEAGEGVAVGSDNKTPAASREISYEVSDESILSISSSGKMTALSPGKATVRAYVELGESKYYSNEVEITVTEKVDSDNNAYLEKAEFSDGLTWNAAFESDYLHYVAVADQNNVSMSLKTEDSGASLEVYVNNEKAAYGGSALEANLTIDENNDNTKIYVRVISPNQKNTNVYEFDIIRASAECTFLSDLDYETDKTTNGWGTIQKDRSIENRTITLIDANNQEKTFKKGLGAHATCNIVYNIAGKGYANFSTYVGIDREMAAQSGASAKFMIYGDDSLLAETDVMGVNTPMELLSVAVDGVKELRLVADNVDGDSYDHVDFADAKFLNRDTYTVWYRSSSENRGTVSAASGNMQMPGGFFAARNTDSITLTAEALEEEKYIFTGWYDADGNRCEENTVFTVTGFRSDMSYTARFQPVNLSALQEALDAKASQDTLNGSTTSSVEAYNKALADAERLLTDTDATADDISQAILELESKKKALAPKGDSSKLTEAIEEEKNTVLTGYTAQSVEEYQAALQAVKDLLERADDATDEDITQILQKLAQAKANLVTIASGLEAAIRDAEQLEVELENCTVGSVSEYREALQAVKDLLENAENVSEEEMYEAIGRLAAAKEALKPKGSASGLQKAIEAAKKDLSGYTPESAAVYSAALKEAEELLKNADNASQEEIDAALNKLKAAEGALQLKQGSTGNTGNGDNGDHTASVLPKNGELIDDGIFTYKVTKSDAKNGTVSLVKVNNKKKAKVVIPDSIKKNEYEFKVTSIDKNVFQNNKKINTVTIGKNVTSIGANAFKKCTKLKTVNWKGTKAPKIKGGAFKGTKVKTVTVPKKMAGKQLKTLQKRLKSAGVKGSVNYKKKK